MGVPVVGELDFLYGMARMMSVLSVEKIETGERDQYTAKPLPLNHATHANDKSSDQETPEPQIVSPRRAVLRLTFPREHRPPP